MEEKSRLKWVDILKSFGIFAVAFGHIYRQENVLCWLYTFHVPLFFIAGGIVFRPSEILRNIKRRAFRILVPYAVFGVLMALYFSLIEYRWRDISMSLPDCLLGLVIGDMDHLEFHSHLWFLPCYFLTAVAYNALYRLLRPLGCRLVCAGACVVYMLFPLPSLPWGADRALGFLGLFALGNLAAEKGLLNRAEKLPAPVQLGAAVLLLGLSVGLASMYLTRGLMWTVCAIVGTAGFMALSMALEKLRIPAEIMSGAGRGTLVALCIHGPIYRILLKLAAMASGSTTDILRMNVFSSLAVTAVTLVICLGVFRLLERFLPWCIGIVPAKKEKRPPENGS